MSLRFATRLLFFFFLFFGGLYYAKGFLIPIAFAGVLAMLLLPLANWFEKKGAGKSLATTMSVLAFVVAVAGLFALLGWQVKSLLSDMGNIEQKITQSVSSGQQWLTEKVGLESSGSSQGGKGAEASGAQQDSTTSGSQQHDSTHTVASASSEGLGDSTSSKSQSVPAQPSDSANADSSQSSQQATAPNSSSGQNTSAQKSSGGGIGADLKKSLGSSGGGGLGKTIQSLPATILSSFADLLITLVYLFLFLRFRLHLKRFILKIVPEPDRRTALDIIHQSSGVTQKYLSGMGLMIVCLWIMYGIGFSIAGVKGALFFAVLCGTLELVPFVGNLIGTALTILISLTQSEGGGSSVVLGILITYFVVQTIQSYLLEPLVVGSQVKLHPLFTILIIVLGETVWGIPGMVLSVPLLGIAKIIFDRVPALQSYGYLIGEEENVNDPSWKERIRGKLSRVFRRG
jgi:predicted PurR-regulated permease PerM